jgi:hypothetical protein
MPQLTDQQIDFIINDIRARGVMMESLHDDLVDHVCCVLERLPEESSSFEQRYQSVIRTFYKKELSEIEDETKMLLNNKNYYAMKKVMIVSGIASALFLAIGIAFKFMHLPGAGMGIVLGAGIFSLLFLPLTVLLKLKEEKSSRDKALIITGTLAAVMLSIGIVFKIMWWPYANLLGMLSIGVLCLVYLPINLFTGLRNADTKVNSVVTSVVLVAGCALFLSLVRSPHGTRAMEEHETALFFRSENLVKNEMMMTPLFDQKAIAAIASLEDMKSFLLRNETGYEKLPDNYESLNAFIGESRIDIYIGETGEGRELFDKMNKLVQEYNNSCYKNPLPLNTSLFGSTSAKVNDALREIVLLELEILQMQKTSGKM